MFCQQLILLLSRSQNWKPWPCLGRVRSGESDTVCAFSGCGSMWQNFLTKLHQKKPRWEARNWHFSHAKRENESQVVTAGGWEEHDYDGFGDSLCALARFTCLLFPAVLELFYIACFFFFLGRVQIENYQSAKSILIAWLGFTFLLFFLFFSFWLGLIPLRGCWPCCSHVDT